MYVIIDRVPHYFKRKGIRFHLFILINKIKGKEIGIVEENI